MSDGNLRPNYVRLRREQNFMTQEELSRRSGISPRTIYSVEKGQKCRMDTKRKILYGLGLPFSDRDLVFPPFAS